MEGSQIIAIYEDAPYFVSGVEFSGADGNVLRNNAIFLDALTQQPVSIFPQALYKEAYSGMFPDPNNGEQPNVWRGAFQYRSGANTATYIVNSTPATNERLRIYHRRLTDTITNINTPGTLVYDAAYPTTITAVTVDMTSAGYTDGEIIEVTAQVYFPGPSYVKTGLFFMRDAYTGNIASLTTAYPGVPTFGAGSTVTAANLNQLSNAQDWIMSYLSLVPRVPFEAGMFALGTHKSTTANGNNPRVIYVGHIVKETGLDTFHGIIDYYSFNGSEVIQVAIGGTQFYQSAALTNGNHGTLDFTFDISSLTNGANYTVVVWQEIASGQGQQELALYGDSIIATRFTIKKLEATATRSYYSPSADFDVLESMTYSTLKSRLNNFVTGTTAAYNRINNNDHLFNKARMFRRKFGWNRKQVSSLNWVNLPTQVRIGERFVVAGKDVKIAWNGYSLTKNFLETPADRDIYEFASVETLTGSDKVEVKEGYFDQFKSLYPGTQYYLLGEEISFFSEYLR